MRTTVGASFVRLTIESVMILFALITAVPIAPARSPINALIGENLMPRIRSLHPGQWSDDKFVELSDGARLLALAVRNFSDDAGIFEWNPRKLMMWCFPADNRNIKPLLDELERHSVVTRYAVDGKEYGKIRNFLKFQRVQRPKFQYPTNDKPDNSTIDPSTSHSDSMNSHVEKLKQSTNDPLSDATKSRNLNSEVGGRREGVGVLHQHRALPSDSQSRSDSARAEKITEPNGGLALPAGGPSSPPSATKTTQRVGEITPDLAITDKLAARASRTHQSPEGEAE